MTAVGQINAGGRITAAMLRGIAPFAAYKVSTTTITSSTTLTNDPDLSIPLAASSWYKVIAMLSYQAAATGVYMKWSFALPSGSDSGVYGVTYIATGGSLLAEIHSWADTPVGGTPSANTGYPVIIEGMVHTGTSSGNLTLQWAQSNSSASGTSLNAKSHLALWQVG